MFLVLTGSDYPLPKTAKYMATIMLSNFNEVDDYVMHYYVEIMS